MASLKTRIMEDTALNGPMPLSRYMALCLSDPAEGYYATRHPFGPEGDFITAPELSQIFGELIGIWLIAAWHALGEPAQLRLVELGPGSGALMQDILRSLRLRPRLLKSLQIELVELPGPLRKLQKQRLEGAPCPLRWCDRLEAGPLPTLVVANEFFDAVPVSVFVRTKNGFAERHVVTDKDKRLVFADLPVDAPDFAKFPVFLPAGTVFELAPQRYQLAAQIAGQIKKSTGAALIIDYGYVQPKTGATLQALKGHKHTHPLREPGQADLTALVDFTALGAAFGSPGCPVWGPIYQRDFLCNMGIRERLDRLSQSQNEAEREKMQQAVHRLIHPSKMGELFKVMACVSFHEPPPAFQLQHKA